MRAIKIEENLNVGQLLHLVGDKHHHLKNVLRLKRNHDVLLLVGEGKSFLAKVESIDKKETILKVDEECEVVSKPSVKIDLYMGLVKKDALESCLKSAVEMGVESIYLIKTINSQKYEINTSRIEIIINNAIEQSNIKYFPKFEMLDFKAIDLNKIGKVVLATNKKDQSELKIDENSKRMSLFIGPEAGFTEEEEQELLKVGSVINLSTGILRTRTAVPALLGFLHAGMLKN